MISEPMTCVFFFLLSVSWYKELLSIVNMNFNPLHGGFYPKNTPIVELLYVSVVALITISTLQESQ